MWVVITNLGLNAARLSNEVSEVLECFVNQDIGGAAQRNCKDFNVAKKSECGDKKRGYIGKARSRFKQ